MGFQSHASVHSVQSSEKCQVSCGVMVCFHVKVVTRLVREK